MKAKKSSFIRGLLLVLFMCVFAFALTACGDKDKTTTPETPGNDSAPEVKNLMITAAQGAEYGKVDEEHILSFTATEGSEITVTVKKGSADAVINTDYTYNTTSKVIVFKEAATYTVKVTATLNGKSGSDSRTITITNKEPGVPEVTAVELTHKSGDAGYVGAVYTVSYTVTPANTDVEITVMKDGDEADEGTDYTMSGSDITFLKAGTYTVVATPEEGEAKESDSVTIALPSVSNLAVTANDGIGGYVGAVYTISYVVAPQGRSVAITVKKGTEDAVKDEDYTLEGMTLNFLVEGTYKVVATPQGGNAVESDSIVIVEPTVEVSAAGTANRGEPIELTITTTPAGLPVTVTVLAVDDGETEVNASQYVYNSANKTVVITAPVGTYKIKVTITGTEVSDTTSEISLVQPPVPTFDLSAEETSIKENEETTITVGAITYPTEGHEFGSDEWTFEYSATGTDYATANTSDYEWTEDTKTFKALKAGSFKINYSVTCDNSDTGSEFVIITVTPAELTLTAVTEGWISANETDLAYTVDGYAAHYLVTYEAKVLAGQGDVTKNSATELEAQSRVNVTANAIVAEYTVTYTHSVNSDVKYTVTFYVYGAEADGPEFGDDVTHNVLLPDVALKLYADEEDGAIVEYTLFDENKAEIFEIANVGKVIKLKDGAEGTITVAVLATKNGKSSASVQTFTVSTRKGENAMNNYLAAVTGKAVGSVDYNWLDNDHSADKQHEKNILLTKEGVVFNPYNSDVLEGGDLLQIKLNENGSNKTNLQFEFDFTILGRHSASDNNKSNNMSLAIYFVPKDNWGGNSVIAMYTDNEKGMFTYAPSGAKVEGTTPLFPEGNGIGFKMHVRISRMIANDKMVYVLEWAEAGSTDYKTWITLTMNAENNGTSMGSPLDRIQFTHECGSYAIENLTYNGNLTLPTLDVTLEKEEMRVNESTSLTYTLQNAIVDGVTMQVYKNDQEVAKEKYTYEGNTLSFAEAGTYKLVFTAVGAVTVEKTITVNEVPTVKVELPAVVKVDTEASITITVNHSAEEPQVKVQKLNGETYEDYTTGYTYDGEGHTITFTEVGTYKVIASIEDGEIYGEATIIVANASAPTLTVTASESSVVEGAAVTMTVTDIAYDETNGDAAGDGTITYTVLYAATGSDHAPIEENADKYYAISGNEVTLKMAGNYRIQASVTSNLGIVGTAHADVTATPAELHLSFGGTLKNGWYRMTANDTDTDIVYTVEGNRENYTVAFENGAASQNAPSGPTSGLVMVHWTEQNTYLVKVIYTHKVLTNVKYELEIKVHAVADLANSPILGVDPFGDTPDELIPSLATKLYHDVYSANGETALGDSAVSYAMVGGIENLEYSGSAPSVSIGNTANEAFDAAASFPFVIVSNFENNSAHGTITVKMTITDGSNVTYASKTFIVTATNEVSTTDAAAVNAYLQRVFPGTPLRADNMTFNSRQNCILAKGGFVSARHQTDWANGGSWGDFAQIQITDNVASNPVNDFQIDFDYSILTKNGGGLTEIHMFPVTGNGLKRVDNQFVLFNTASAFGSCLWAGDNKIESIGGHKDSTNENGKAWDPATNDYVKSSNPEGVTVGTKIHVRLIHRVVGDTVRYELYFGEYGSDSAATLTPWFVAIFDKSSNDGHYGSPVSNIRLTPIAGCFGFENVTLINLDA